VADTGVTLVSESACCTQLINKRMGDTLLIADPEMWLREREVNVQLQKS